MLSAPIMLYFVGVFVFVLGAGHDRSQTTNHNLNGSLVRFSAGGERSWYRRGKWLTISAPIGTFGPRPFLIGWGICNLACASVHR